MSKPKRRTMRRLKRVLGVTAIILALLIAMIPSIGEAYGEGQMQVFDQDGKLAAQTPGISLSVTRVTGDSVSNGARYRLCVLDAQAIDNNNLPDAFKGFISNGFAFQYTLSVRQERDATEISAEYPTYTTFDQVVTSVPGYDIEKILYPAAGNYSYTITFQSTPIANSYAAPCYTSAYLVNSGNYTLLGSQYADTRTWGEVSANTGTQDPTIDLLFVVNAGIDRQLVENVELTDNRAVKDAGHYIGDGGSTVSFNYVIDSDRKSAGDLRGTTEGGMGMPAYKYALTATNSTQTTIAANFIDSNITGDGAWKWRFPQAGSPIYEENKMKMVEIFDIAVTSPGVPAPDVSSSLLERIAPYRMNFTFPSVSTSTTATFQYNFGETSRKTGSELHLAYSTDNGTTWTDSGSLVSGVDKDYVIGGDEGITVTYTLKPTVNKVAVFVFQPTPQRMGKEDRSGFKEDGTTITFPTSTDASVTQNTYVIFKNNGYADTYKTKISVKDASNTDVPLMTYEADSTRPTKKLHAFSVIVAGDEWGTGSTITDYTPFDVRFAIPAEMGYTSLGSYDPHLRLFAEKPDTTWVEVGYDTPSRVSSENGYDYLTFRMESTDNGGGVYEPNYSGNFLLYYSRTGSEDLSGGVVEAYEETSDSFNGKFEVIATGFPAGKWFVIPKRYKSPLEQSTNLYQLLNGIYQSAINGLEKYQYYDISAYRVNTTTGTGYDKVDNITGVNMTITLPLDWDITAKNKIKVFAISTDRTSVDEYFPSVDYGNDLIVLSGVKHLSDFAVYTDISGSEESDPDHPDSKSDLTVEDNRGVSEPKSYAKTTASNKNGLWKLNLEPLTAATELENKVLNKYKDKGYTKLEISYFNIEFYYKNNASDKGFIGPLTTGIEDVLGSDTNIYLWVKLPKDVYKAGDTVSIEAIDTKTDTLADSLFDGTPDQAKDPYFVPITLKSEDLQYKKPYALVIRGSASGSEEDDPSEKTGEKGDLTVVTSGRASFGGIASATSNAHQTIRAKWQLNVSNCTDTAVTDNVEKEIKQYVPKARSTKVVFYHYYIDLVYKNNPTKHVEKNNYEGVDIDVSVPLPTDLNWSSGDTIDVYDSTADGVHSVADGASDGSYVTIPLKGHINQHNPYTFVYIPSAASPSDGYSIAVDYSGDVTNITGRGGATAETTEKDHENWHVIFTQLANPTKTDIGKKIITWKGKTNYSSSSKTKSTIEAYDIKLQKWDAAGNVIEEITLLDLKEDAENDNDRETVHIKLPVQPSLAKNGGTYSVWALYGDSLEKLAGFKNANSSSDVEYMEFDTYHFSQYAVLYNPNEDPKPDPEKKDDSGTTKSSTTSSSNAGTSSSNTGSSSASTASSSNTGSSSTGGGGGNRASGDPTYNGTGKANTADATTYKAIFILILLAFGAFELVSSMPAKRKARPKE